MPDWYAGAPDNLKLRVVKKVDDSNERIYEQEIRMGDGVVKKLEVELSSRLTAEGKRLEAERSAKAEKTAADAGFILEEDVLRDSPQPK